MASKDQRQPRRAEAVLYGGVSPLQLEETWPSIRLCASSDFLASRHYFLAITVPKRAPSAHSQCIRLFTSPQSVEMGDIEGGGYD
ncbi:hypothetical protein Q7C36_014500 [Tachysurus vachellii]|uniref:Uncharacterized protein n=1 Tax=Tachysurus vachellii TaxID=175792 RepID=A0AA88MGI2_TACVA|nr:hypothetical protein Q7C36_014500 [Tachysurus vachellii]